MNRSKVFGRIRITKIPDGEAPLDVRKAWVGLVLPCHPYMGYPDNFQDKGVVSKTEATHNRRGFSVPQDRAIAVLEKTSPTAANWWRANGFPEQDQFFGFAENEAEIVSGVLHQRIVEVRDEDHGDPYR